jgi:beta-galactosidase
VRNGGFPDWLQKKGDDKEFELRRDNPGYLGYVAQLYSQIGQQTKGLLWKDGGPVIGVQLENEYTLISGGPVQHLMTLKRMARDSGIDVPLYTCTGWGSAGEPPFGEILPFSGSYPDGFWDRSILPAAHGYGRVFRFSDSRRVSAAAMGVAGGAQAAAKPEERAGIYPYLMCELGGGMMPSYHRRIVTYPSDAESLALVKLGSGVNLLGFYMYHGGENPDGRLSYLNETQASGFWNDLPVKNYDFRAPIGGFGQEREHYHWLRLLGLFLHDYGSGMARMSPRIPSTQGALNWAVRSDGDAGYIFVSNYQRLSPQPDQKNVQFRVSFATGDVTVPSDPVAIPDNSRFFWPANLDLGGIRLAYATAQPICHVDDGNTRYTVFKQTAGVPSEFAFDGTTAALEASTGQAATEGSSIHVRNVQPGTGDAIRLRGHDGMNYVIVLLDEARALDLWKGQWHGRERLFLTHANLLIDGPALRLRVKEPSDGAIEILPATEGLTDGREAVAASEDGLFRRFSPRIANEEPLSVSIVQMKSAGSARAVPIAPSIPGRPGMAMQPDDADFAQAAVWNVKLPAGIDPGRDILVRVRYSGDVIRAYLGDRLLTDDFYSGQPLEIGLRRYGPAVYQDGIVLKILPLREDAPIYFTERSRLKFNGDHVALGLEGVDVVETHEIRLQAAADALFGR